MWREKENWLSRTSPSLHVLPDPEVCPRRPQGLDIGMHLQQKQLSLTRINFSWQTAMHYEMFDSRWWRLPSPVHYWFKFSFHWGHLHQGVFEEGLQHYEASLSPLSRTVHTPPIWTQATENLDQVLWTSEQFLPTGRQSDFWTDLPDRHLHIQTEIPPQPYSHLLHYLLHPATWHLRNTFAHCIYWIIHVHVLFTGIIHVQW